MRTLLLSFFAFCLFSLIFPAFRSYLFILKSIVLFQFFSFHFQIYIICLLLLYLLSLLFFSWFLIIYIALFILFPFYCFLLLLLRPFGFRDNMNFLMSEETPSFYSKIWNQFHATTSHRCNSFKIVLSSGSY